MDLEGSRGSCLLRCTQPFPSGFRVPRVSAREGVFASPHERASSGPAPLEDGTRVFGSRGPPRGLKDTKDVRGHVSETTPRDLGHSTRPHPLPSPELRPTRDHIPELVRKPRGGASTTLARLSASFHQLIPAAPMRVAAASGWAGHCRPVSAARCRLQRAASRVPAVSDLAAAARRQAFRLRRSSSASSHPSFT
jgi:hypothetical protein